MKHTIKLSFILTGTLAMMTACGHVSKTQDTVATPSQPNAVELVDSLNHVFGNHHARASHAKGFCATGVFTPSEQANHLSKSILFSNPSEAVVRFSIGGGNPRASDKSRSIRGIAVRLTHANALHDLVMISEPVFFASTPESFVSFLQARVADPETKKSNPEKIKAHSEKYPESKLQGSLVAAHAAPSSYATTPYFTTHAFGLVNAKNKTQWARLSFEPSAGVNYLSEEQEKSFADNFLEDELSARLMNGAAEFTLYAQLADKSDTLVNPTVEWPHERPRVALGVLIVKTVSGQRCDSESFVPTNLPVGVIPSNDPILKARASAYAVSKSRR